MIVCICHRVSDRDIQRAAREGCNSFETLQADLRVASACGRCRDCAHSTFAQARSVQPPVAGVVAASAQRSWHALAAA